MSERRLAALRRALTAPLGPHLDDETLALVVTAEAAGEDVDERHASALTHVERCPSCLASYEELSLMMSEALSAMSAAAAALSPEELYAELLFQQLTRDGVAQEAAHELAQQLAASLPLLLDVAPHHEGLDEQHVRAALARAPQASQLHAEAPDTLAVLLHALQETVSALGLYLQGRAAAVWGRGVSVSAYSVAGWNRLQLSLLSPLHESLLSAEGSQAQQWELFHQRVGQPLPITVRARAERLGPLSCRLVVSAARPGKRDASGRDVRLRLGAQILAAETDAQGEARFEPLPIAAVGALAIEIEEG